MRVLAWLLLLLLIGCEGAEQPAEAEPRESVFEPLTGTLDRAEGVEDTLRESADERRRLIDEAEGP